MNRKLIAIILALACTMAMCLPVLAEKPSGSGNYLAGVVDSDTDPDTAVETLMDGFEYVYSGVYNEEEGYEIILAFDTTNSYGAVGITQPSTNTLFWALIGEWTSEDGTESFSSEYQDYPFNFVIEEETDDGMVISLPDDGDGQLTLSAVDLSELEDFFTKMINGEFTEDGSSDSGDSDDSDSSYDSDSSVSTMMEGYDYVYYGDYNTSEGYKILLAFDTTNSAGFLAVTQPSSNTLVWMIMGEWTSDNDVESFSSDYSDYPFNFTIKEWTDDELVITLPDDGNGQLTLKAADLSDLEDFLTKMVNGDFAEE